MLDTHGRKYVEPAISRTARLFLKFGLKANQITWIAFLLGSATGVLIYFQYSLVAVIFLWISGYLDAVDGSMAREQNKSTAWGTLLDITFDRIVELSVIIGLALRYPHVQFLLLLLTGAIVFSMTVFLSVGALSERKGIKSFYYQAGLAERTEGFILFTLMVLFPEWLMWTTGLFFVLEVFTAIQRMAEANRLLCK
jgi:phosphatidylglycerophosphate synthase